MAMVVRSNLMAINANRQLGMNNSQVSKSLEKLSSGFRINRAGDDASGLAISEKMKAQIKGLEQASSNSQDGISLVQTAEGAMTEVHNMLNRMVELATKSANGTISDKVDRDAIQSEVDQLLEEIDRIGDSTNFNGINLLDGSMGKSGGASGAKGAADVAVDALNGALLKDVAATKASSTLGQLTDVMTASQPATFEFTYKDNTGAAKSIKIELINDATTTLKYKVNGGELKTFSGTGTAAGAHTGTIQVSAIKEALADTELGELFDMSGTDTLAFTAKNPGDTKAEILLVKNDVDTSGTMANTAVTTVKGAEQFHQLALDSMAAYDGTDATKSNIFEVNGKKFAFVAAGTDTSKFSPDITTVALTGTKSDDVASMAQKINETFGAGTAEVDATTNTTINFKPVAGKTSSGTGGLTLQVGDTNDNFNKVTVQVDDIRSAGLGIKGLKVNTQDTAGDSIETIKNAINKVSTNRGNLGALQNRLEYAINNLDVTAENMTNANSRIRDTDMAKEMMNYTKMNVLTQSAQAMLAQANQSPQSILQLLQ